jgi:hypothetical protein
MGIRYNRRSRILTDSDGIHEELLESRDIKAVEHYDTPSFERLTLENRYSLQNRHHVWGVGDRYWKLASEHYGNSNLWWLIAWYNQKPTDAHVKAGDSIAIPFPLDKVLTLFYR